MCFDCGLSYGMRRQTASMMFERVLDDTLDSTCSTCSVGVLAGLNLLRLRPVLCLTTTWIRPVPLAALVCWRIWDYFDVIASRAEHQAEFVPSTALLHFGGSPLACGEKDGAGSLRRMRPRWWTAELAQYGPLQTLFALVTLSFCCSFSFANDATFVRCFSFWCGLLWLVWTFGPDPP